MDTIIREISERMNGSRWSAIADALEDAGFFVTADEDDRPDVSDVWDDCDRRKHYAQIVGVSEAEIILTADRCPVCNEPNCTDDDCARTIEYDEWLERQSPESLYM